MKRSLIETVIGAVVVLVAAAFLVFAYQTANLATTAGYRVSAGFSDVGGLSVGADARIAGVNVGTVTAMTLDPATYLAQVEITVRPDVELPTDTAAIVASESLLGGRFIRLEPGADDVMLADGGRITYTQSNPGLEELLGQVIFGTTAQGGGS